MDPARFGSNATGRLVSLGLPRTPFAFVPDPLPPAWEWPSQLWPLLLNARAALAKLDGIGKHLPNPELILRPLQTREAQRSNSLEGTITKPEEQLLFELDPRYPESESDPANAWREVFNYGQALRYGLHALEDLPISLRVIRELHRILLDGVRGANRTPGEFRRLPAQIGRPARFVPPPPNLISDCLDAFEKYLHGELKFDPLVECFLIHYQFETIHPFSDGNGRVGRLLLAVMIKEWCGLSNQWLYMSAYFESHKDEYIDRLFRISTEGRWEDWMEFCLLGVTEEAIDAERRCDRLLRLQREFYDLAQGQGGSIRLTSIIDDLFVSPIVQVAPLARKHQVTYPTSKSDVERLVALGILTETTVMPVRTFYAPRIMDIIYEDDLEQREA